jgi:hypothetical protein
MLCIQIYAHKNVYSNSKKTCSESCKHHVVNCSLDLTEFSVKILNLVFNIKYKNIILCSRALKPVSDVVEPLLTRQRQQARG